MLQILILILYALGGLTGLGLIAGMMEWAFDGTMNVEAMVALTVLTFVWVAIGVMLQRLQESWKQRRVIATSRKAKRGATDMYAMIDRLVYELTPDERSYLLRRLDDTDQMEDDEDDLDTTLEALLSERQEQRLSK